MMYSLRLAGSSYSSTGLGFALSRLGGKGGGGAAPAAGLVAPAVAAQVGGRRSVSATSSAAAPVPGDQGVGMDPARQQQQAPPPHKPEGKKEDDDKQKTEHRDVMSDSFGQWYWTRADEEGFGGVYGQNEDPVFKHPPEYDTSQGSEVKEKEKVCHLKDDKHAVY